LTVEGRASLGGSNPLIVFNTHAPLAFTASGACLQQIPLIYLPEPPELMNIKEPYLPPLLPAVHGSLNSPGNSSFKGSGASWQSNLCTKNIIAHKLMTLLVLNRNSSLKEVGVCLLIYKMLAKRHLTPNPPGSVDAKGRPRTHEARATSRVDLGGEERYIFVGSPLFVVHISFLVVGMCYLTVADTKGVHLLNLIEEFSTLQIKLVIDYVRRMN
jgi:hypothetical protein